MALYLQIPVQKNGIQYTLPPLPSPLISAFIFSQLLSILPHSATSAISKPSPAPYFCLHAAAPAAFRVRYELRKQPGPITYGTTLLPLHNHSTRLDYVLFRGHLLTTTSYSVSLRFQTSTAASSAVAPPNRKKYPARSVLSPV
jgi:hypothetical protein